MTSLTAHVAALRRMRRLAREADAIVVCRPTGADDQDVYEVHDLQTGAVRGRFTATRRHLDKVDVDAFFAGLST